MRWPGVFLRVFFLLLFRWIAWRLIRAEPISDIVFAVTAGILIHGVHAETAQRITEAPAFHAEGVKGGSSYGKTKADFKSEE